MKKWKKSLGFTGMTLLLSMSVLAGCGGNQAAKSQTDTNGSASKSAEASQTSSKDAAKTNFTKENPGVIRLAHQLVPDSQLNKTMIKFKEVVETKSEGRLKVEIYPSGQLFSEKEVPAQIQKGTLEMGDGFRFFVVRNLSGRGDL